MQIVLKNRKIGNDNHVFIIAEMSGNHNKDIVRARQIIDGAAAAGADAIKFQTYTPDTITINSDKDYFKVTVNKEWEGKNLYKLYEEAFTPWEWQAELKKYAESLGLICFSTPFDNTSVDFLEGIGVELYKIASFEVVDIPLLQRIGKTKKPVIMSCGMASIEEIDLAVETLKKNGTPALVLLYCVSAYPAQTKDMNLKTILKMKERYNLSVGLSDHTLDNIAPLVAVSLGATVIEKHLTLARVDGGADSSFSLEVDEFKKMVQDVRAAESALGGFHFGPGLGEKESVKYRKSLFVVEDIKKGENFNNKNVRSIRPGYGLAPKYYDEIIGKKAVVDIERGEPLDWKMIDSYKI